MIATSDHSKYKGTIKLLTKLLSESVVLSYAWSNRVQAPEDDLNNLKWTLEEKGEVETVDPQFLLGGVFLTSFTRSSCLGGTTVVDVILVKGNMFPSIVKVHLVGRRRLNEDLESTRGERCQGLHRDAFCSDIDSKYGAMPPFVLESNDDHGKTYYSDSLTLGPEYREDKSISKEIRHLMKLEERQDTKRRCRKAQLLEDKQIPSVGVFDEVFSTWMAFGGNTCDLGSFGEETDEIIDLHQILQEVLLTEHGDGIALRRRRDPSGDGVRT
ncbi:hypothetical protein Tco_1058077 [Tanacetum coccineum]|uniref:Uncharacterized protein n=1 Tax=Tanacetum coccineum TaxID=301880 RepID=A0ABQ5H763_9ASTR